MTAVLERPALTDEIVAALQRADDLVDDRWGGGSLWQNEGKTCLLGLIALSVDAPIDYGTFGELDHYNAGEDGHPAAKRVAAYVADHVPPDPDGGDQVQAIYSFNDEHLRNPEAVHRFLQELVNL